MDAGIRNLGNKRSDSYDRQQGQQRGEQDLRDGGGDRCDDTGREHERA